MIALRRSGERGHAQHGWLDSYHTFSFADYYDPKHMGFRALRVINEDRVQAGKGFGTHSHRDMEIVSYVLEGALAHKDSMGNVGSASPSGAQGNVGSASPSGALGTGSTIRPGDVQRMSAGTGVAHSEFNASRDELVHFLQIWLLPIKQGMKPGYEQKTFPREEKLGKLRLIASPDGRDGSVTIHTDASIHAGLFDKGAAAELPLSKGRHAWVHMARGKARVNGHDLDVGDAVAMSDVPAVQIEGVDAAEVLVFDLG